MADLNELDRNYLKFLAASFYLIRRRFYNHGVDPSEQVQELLEAGAIEARDAEVLNYHIREWLRNRGTGQTS